MNVKAAMHTLVGHLPAAGVLEYLQWLTSDVETLSPEQLARVRHGEEQIARGEHVTLAEVVRLRGE